MLETEDLKTWLHRRLGQRDKLLIALATFDQPCAVKDIVGRAVQAGFRVPRNWNVSAILSSTKGLAIRTPDGWEITNSGKQHLRNLGVSKLSPAAVQAATDLRAHLPTIANQTTRAFAEEAVKCHEAELHRSAIVMSWLAAIDVLYAEVLKNHLATFNAEAVRIDAKWRPAKTADDLARMKESDFLDRLVAISVIGKSTKDQLKNALTLRNGCGHPNSLKVGTNAVAAHLESLLLNIFQAFNP